jgi:hypothetical protein
MAQFQLPKASTKSTTLAFMIEFGISTFKLDIRIPSAIQHMLQAFTLRPLPIDQKELYSTQLFDLIKVFHRIFGFDLHLLELNDSNGEYETVTVEICF